MKLDKTVKPELEWIGRERSYTIHEDENDGATFPDGSRVTTCTSWAIQARRLLGERAEIFGFFVDENDEATAMARLADGHDFVMVDGRYILDGWLCELEGDIDYPIVDLQDPANEDLVRSYYGDPECWTRATGLEEEIDHEAPAIRARALDGIAIPSPSEEPAQSSPKSLTQEDRIAEVNAVIDAMAGHGRRFFFHERSGRTARFELDDKRRVMFRDDYIDTPIAVRRGRDWKRNFSHGGTLKSLVEDMADYIEFETPIPAGNFGPWNESTNRGDLWGYGKDEMAKLRAMIADNPAVETREFKAEPEEDSVAPAFGP